MYADKAAYDEECAQHDAVRALAGMFGFSEHAIRRAKLSPACIGEILSIIKKHKTG